MYEMFDADGEARQGPTKETGKQQSSQEKDGLTVG